MNREIKFRGKQENSNRWITGCLIQYESGDVAIFEKMMTKYGYEATQITKRTKVNSDTIGQFTGLTDKNGKEIYEGDILRVICRGNEFACLVGWNYEIGAWCISIGDTYVGVKPLGGWLCDGQFEVIGNIHDNPELLEG